MSEKHQIKVPVTYTFDRSDIQNILESAMERHSTYWMSPVKIEDLSKDTCIIKEDYDEEEELEHTFSKAHVIRGLYNLSRSKEYFHHFAAIIEEEDDGVTADVLLQFVVFGEVKYS